MKTIIIALFIVVSGYAQCPAAYTAQRTVTVNSGQVSGTLTNYPRLVLNPTTGQADPNNLKTTGNGGRVTSANGYDIIFVNASGTLLDFELVGHGTASTTYDAATGNAEFRVKVASEAVGSVVYLCYGNAAVTTYQGNDSGTWGSAVGVWHFGTASSLALTDSSASANTLTNASSAAVAGQITGGVSTTSTHYLTGSDTALGFGSGAFSVGGWFKTSSATNSILLNFGTPSGVQQAYLGIYDLGGGHKAAIIGNGTTNITGTTDLNDGAWHQITATNDGAGTTRLYVDGALVTSGLITWSIVSGGASGLAIGRDNAGATQTFTGDSDEITAIGSQRTASWIAASYNNESAPGTYYAVGIETSPLSTMTVSPTRILKSTAGIVLTLSGINTSWSGGSTVFTVSGVSGTSKTAQSVSSATSATVTVTTGSTTGTLTVTETVTGATAATTTVYAAFTTTVQGTSNTQAILSYNQPESCTIEVSESPTYSPLVHDVDPALFSGSDVDSTRTDAIINGAYKQVPIGKRIAGQALTSDYYSRALQAFTSHYFRITCGLNVSTGSFTTKNIPTGNFRNDFEPPTDGYWSTPTIGSSRNQKVVDPLFGTLYSRQTIGADVAAAPVYGFQQGFGGLTRPHTNQLFTSGDGQQGYVSVYWDANAGGAMYFFIPATGETRFIGDTGGIIYPVMRDDKTFLQYRGDLTPTGLYNMPYAGTFMPGDWSIGTPVLNQSGASGGACTELNIFDPTRFPTPFADYECALVPTYANEYTAFFFQNTGYPHQDAPGVEGVWWGGDGRPYDSACTAGPTLCPHIVAAYIIGSPGSPNGCTNHNNEMASTDLVKLNLKSNDGSCPGGFASVVFWPFLTDPTGAGIVPGPWGFGGHDDIKGYGPFSANGATSGPAFGPTARLEESSSFCPGGPNGCAYDVVIANPQSASLATNPTTAVGAYNPFAGTTSPANFGLVRHPNWENDPTQSSAQNAATFWDHIPYGGGGGPGVNDIVADSVTLVSGKTNTYLFVGKHPLFRKQQETFARTSYRMLSDISGPTSVLADTFGLGQYCVADVAGECLAGSSAGDIYFNPPEALAALGCAGSESPNIGVADICIEAASLHAANLGQFWGLGGVEASDKSRMLGHALMPSISFASAGSTFKPYPDSSWATFQQGLFDAGVMSIWAAKIPPYPPADTINRTNFVPIPVRVPATSGVDNVVVKFGYAEYASFGQVATVVFEGDSITAYATSPGNMYPEVTSAALASAIDGHNLAVSGSIVPELFPFNSLEARRTSVDSVFAGSAKPIKIESILIGHNDVGAGFTPAQFVANLKSYCLARKAATPGLKILIIPVLPSTDTGFNAIRNDYNALIVADPSFYDVFLSAVLSDVNLGIDSAASNTTYFVDGTHLTILGESTLAGHVTTALRAMYATPEQYRCTTRAESCVAGGGVAPFAFALTETITGTSCNSGCVVDIPAVSGRMLYFSVQYRNSSTLVSSGTMQVVIVP